ncbi:MAG: hypothetical protein KU28_11560 [Sulfurovum sp. PC08-66]|nr:MAG: hypothetical protein KU28_11560 [Sulfurovum sp. PC08-66]
METFLVAYDIFDTKRLRKVKHIVYSYSLGGQRSALETPLSLSLMKELLERVSTIVEEHDQMNLIRIIDKPILLGKAQFTSFENRGVIIL